MKTKPFNIDEAKAGAKVVTRDGRPARIVCWDAKGKYPIIALLDCGKEGEIPYNYTTHGTTVIGCVTSDYDLFLVDETPELTEFEQEVESICLSMQAGGRIDDIHTLSNNLLAIARKELPTNEEMLCTLHLEYEKGRADAFAEMEAHGKFIGIKDFENIRCNDFNETDKDILVSFFDGKISGINEVLENPNKYGLVKVMED